MGKQTKPCKITDRSFFKKTQKALSQAASFSLCHNFKLWLEANRKPVWANWKGDNLLLACLRTIHNIFSQTGLLNHL